MRGNPKNHSKAGDSISVEPMRRARNIESIKILLQDCPHNLLLFFCGLIMD